MCQRTFTDCNKHTTVVRHINSGRGCAYVGTGSTWEFSVPSAKFALNLKLL